MKRLLPGGTWRARGFGRNVMTLASGTALAQAIGVLVTPLLTRLYLPEHFGISALWASVVAMVAIVVCGRYEVALVLPERRQDAHNLMALSMLIAAVVTALMLLAVGLVGKPFARMLNAPGLYPWLWLAPVSVLALGIQQTLNYWNTRNGTYHHLSVAQIGQALGTNASQLVAAGVGHSGAGGLVAGRVIGNAAGAGLLLGQFRNADGRGLLTSIRWSQMKVMAREYGQFPKHLLAAHILNTFALQLPIFVLTHVSTALAGLFSLAFRLLGVPMTLISGSIAQVFYAEAAREHVTTGKCLALYRRTLIKLTCVSAVVFIPILLVGDYVYVRLLGNEWSGFSAVVRSLVPLCLVRFVTSPLTSVFLVAHRTELYFWFQLALALSAFAGLGVGHWLGGGMYYLWGYSLAVTVISLASLPSSYRIASEGWSPAATISLAKQSDDWGVP